MSGVRVWEWYVTARIAYLVPACTYKYQGTSQFKHVTIVNLCSVLCPLFHWEWRIKPCVDCAHFLVVNLDVRRCHPAILVSFVILWSEVLICDYMILYGILWWKTFRHFYIQYHLYTYLFFGEDSNGLHNDSCWWRLHLLNRPWTVHTVDKTTGFQIHIASSLHMNHVCSGFWLPSKNLTVAKKPDGHSTSFSVVQLGMIIQIFPEHRIDHWSITMLFADRYFRR